MKVISTSDLLYDGVKSIEVIVSDTVFILSQFICLPIAIVIVLIAYTGSGIRRYYDALSSWTTMHLDEQASSRRNVVLTYM